MPLSGKPQEGWPRNPEPQALGSISRSRWGEGIAKPALLRDALVVVVVQLLCRVQLFTAPWTVARCPCPSLGLRIKSEFGKLARAEGHSWQKKQHLPRHERLAWAGQWRDECRREVWSGVRVVWQVRATFWKVFCAALRGLDLIPPKQLTTNRGFKARESKWNRL